MYIKMKKLIIFLFFLGMICKADELPETYIQFKYEVMNTHVEKFGVSFIKEPTFKPMLILLTTFCVNHAIIRHNVKHQNFNTVMMRRRIATIYLVGVTTNVVVYYIEKNRHDKKFKYY